MASSIVWELTFGAHTHRNFPLEILLKLHQPLAVRLERTMNIIRLCSIRKWFEWTSVDQQNYVTWQLRARHSSKIFQTIDSDSKGLWLDKCDCTHHWFVHFQCVAQISFLWKTDKKKQSFPFGKDRNPQPFRDCRPHYVYFYNLRPPVNSR